ncbi:hypothetical protein C0992_008228, partial [Termitomyces sp. T32_za158]
MQSIVRIVPTKHVVTMTELRGGKKKWNLNHLPPGTASKFTSNVVPLVKEKVGTLAPWANLSTPQLQSIIDTVYQDGSYNVEGGDVWHGLVSYRLQSWRNGFATAASSIVKELFEDQDNRGSFDTPEARHSAVQWWLDWKGQEGEETAPYLFRKCVDGEDGCRRKHGFCESPFIVHTLARAHLAFVRPQNPQDLVENLPVGALILALQAVHHALKEYEKDGYRQVDTSRNGDFSFDNYGDTTTRQCTKGGRIIDKFNPRASRWIAPVKNLKTKHWERILHDANEVLKDLSKTRRRTARSTSHASSEHDSVATIKEFILISDSDLSDDEEKNEFGNNYNPNSESEGYTGTYSAGSVNDSGNDLPDQEENNLSESVHD